MKNDVQILKSDLGPLLRIYKTSAGTYWFLILISICVFSILLIMGWAETKNGRAFADDFWIFLIIAVIGLLPVATLIYQLSNVARFYELGVVYENRRSIKTAYWAEICDVWEWHARVNVTGAPLPNQTFFALRTVDGMTVRFSPRLNNIRDLGNFLRSEAKRWGVPVRPGEPPMKNSFVQLAGSRK